MDLTPAEFEMNIKTLDKDNNTQTVDIQYGNTSNEPLTIPQCYLQNRNIPAIYMQIWNQVQHTSSNKKDQFCDQEKLYRALLLTGLDSDVLAKVWSFVNRTVPGELTRNELIVMLGIIALLQQNKSNPIEDLYRMTSIPVPVFISSASSSQPSQVTKNEQKPQDVFCDDQFEEFADFESAKFDQNLNLSVENEKSNFSKIEETRDKYSYFRDIENLQNEAPKTPVDEFGDFLSHDKDSSHNITPAANESLQVGDDDNSIPSKFYKGYLRVLDKIHTVVVLNDPGEERIFEAFSALDGQEFIQNLYEVQHISDRISASEVFQKMKETSLKKIVDDINVKWNDILAAFNKANVIMFDTKSSPEYSLDSCTELCYICNGQTFGENDSLLFAGVRYHSACANFWLNCVETFLPN